MRQIVVRWAGGTPGYGDARVEGRYAVARPGVDLVTDVGVVPQPSGLSAQYVRLPQTGPRIACTWSDGGPDRAKEWTGTTWLDKGLSCGTNAVIYDNAGLLHVSHCEAPQGAQGWRYVDVDGRLVTCDETYADPLRGLWEWTAWPDLRIGQGGDPVEGAVVWFPDLGLRRLSFQSLRASGPLRNIRAHRVGNNFAITVVDYGQHLTTVTWATLAELRAMPAVVVPKPPDPPVTPPVKPPIPPVEPPVPPKPTPLPSSLTLRCLNQQFVCVEPDGRLVANRDSAGPWETFAIERHGDRVALKSAHGLYVCAEGGGGGVLVVNRPAVGAWELFWLRQANGGWILETDNHHFWCAENGGGGDVNATRTAAGAWETFNGPVPSKPHPPQEPGTARQGIVRGNGFQFADDTGGFLAWGQTLFWAAYGYVFERERIEAHLSAIAATGTDYIRVIATGLRKGTAERSLDPSTASFSQGIAGLTDLAYDTYGLRVQWTIFGATYDAPTKADRIRVVDDFCAALVGRAYKVHAIEIANEGWTNGFAGDAGRDELSALVSRVRDRLPNLVAPTCPAPGDDITKAKVQYYYEGTRATVITEHHARKTGPPDGVFRPTKKPWRETMFLVEGCPKLRRNQEPRGPESSGTETNDPLVLSTDAVVTWLSGEGDYLLHCGAGIYGLADAARGRPADLWDTENYEAICNGIRAMREVLPADLPNFKKHKTNAADAPFGFVDTPDEQLSAAYSASSGSGVGQRIVQPVYGVTKTTTFTLRTGRCDGRAYDPATGTVLAQFDRIFTVTPQQRAVVVIATRIA